MMLTTVAVVASSLTMILVLVLRVRPLSSAAGDTLPNSAMQQRLSVIVPARNEAANLPNLLDDLARQSLLPIEVIVVDDASDDDTAQLAEQSAIGATVDLTVIRLRRTPAGWNPKAWAMVAGTEQASGETLVFLDADVRLAPGALGSLVEAQHQQAVTGGATGIVSVAPHHHPERSIESFSAVCNVITVASGGPGLLRHRSQGAVGACLLIDASVYQRIGGHRANRATIVDDVDLAATAHQHGVPSTLYRGGDLVTVRSYPDGLGQLFRGWVKNLAAGAGHTQPLVGLAVAG